MECISKTYFYCSHYWLDFQCISQTENVSMFLVTLRKQVRNLDYRSALDSVIFIYYCILNVHLKTINLSLICINDDHVIQSRPMHIFSPMLSSLNISVGTLHIACTPIPKTTVLKQKWNCCTNVILTDVLPLIALVPLLAFSFLLLLLEHIADYLHLSRNILPRTGCRVWYNHATYAVYM